MANEIITIETNGKQFALTPQIVKQYICPKATDQEIYYFLQLCKAQNLNPFIREVYLIKYRDGDPASMVTGKEVFLKRAMKNPRFDGQKAWTDGEGETMTATAEIYVKDYKVPISVTVDFKEYAGYTWKDGKRVLNKMWNEKPKTMLRKVALMQALREAFPDELDGMYDEVEINKIPEKLPENEIVIEPIVESKLNPFKEKIKELHEKIGAERYLKIIGNNGYAHSSEIPENEQDGIIEQLEAVAKQIEDQDAE